MSDRFLPELDGQLTWNLVGRGTRQAPETPTPYLNRLQPATYAITNSWAVIIGLNSPSARSNWTTGGWATQQLFISPDSSSGFPALVASEQRRLKLRRQQLCIFPKLMSTWLLEIQFPYWLNDVYFEIWSYDGVDMSVLDRINQLDQEWRPQP